MPAEDWYKRMAGPPARHTPQTPLPEGLSGRGHGSRCHPGGTIDFSREGDDLVLPDLLEQIPPRERYRDRRSVRSTPGTAIVYRGGTASGASAVTLPLRLIQF